MSDEPTSPTRKRPRIDQPRAPPPTTQVKKEADVTAPIKVTKPDWLGDVTIHDGGLSAPAQFSSLALAVFSARCGARSPARALGAHMLRQLWDDWVVGCQRVVAICVAVRDESPDAVELVCSFSDGEPGLLLREATVGR
ncbi:hypothetical protein Pelo_19527 [Pelomyxa schiedti]|nr:hypothetical protein Pelo_19527 [Pelomyxa schiedti]